MLRMTKHTIVELVDDMIDTQEQIRLKDWMRSQWPEGSNHGTQQQNYRHTEVLFLQPLFHSEDSQHDLALPSNCRQCTMVRKNKG